MEVLCPEPGLVFFIPSASCQTLILSLTIEGGTMMADIEPVRPVDFQGKRICCSVSNFNFHVMACLPLFCLFLTVIDWLLSRISIFRETNAPKRVITYKLLFLLSEFRHTKDIHAVSVVLMCVWVFLIVIIIIKHDITTLLTTLKALGKITTVK